MDLTVHLGKWPVVNDDEIIATKLALSRVAGSESRSSHRPAQVSAAPLSLLPGGRRAGGHQSRAGEEFGDLQPGDYITQVNGTPVQNPAEFYAAVRTLKGPGDAASHQRQPRPRAGVGLRVESERVESQKKACVGRTSSGSGLSTLRSRLVAGSGLDSRLVAGSRLSTLRSRLSTLPLWLSTLDSRLVAGSRPSTLDPLKEFCHEAPYRCFLRSCLLPVPALFAAEKLNPPTGSSIVPPNARLERVFTRQVKLDGGLTEGPAVAPDGTIYFSDIPFGKDKGMILRFDPKTKKTTVFADDSHKSNGLMFDAQGRPDRLRRLRLRRPGVSCAGT